MCGLVQGHVTSQDKISLKILNENSENVGVRYDATTNLQCRSKPYLIVNGLELQSLLVYFISILGNHFSIDVQIYEFSIVLLKYP